MNEFQPLLKALAESGVEFILIGGVAGTAYGSARVTFDLDVVYSRTPDNLKRVVKAFESIAPYLRGAPPGLPFHWDEPTIKRGLNFTLDTDLGPVDLLGEIIAGGTYEELLPHSRAVTVFGGDCQCIKLSKLIEVKKAVGRPKDLEAIAELEAIQEERSEGDD
jgi:predicted nucleotidyltransferase